MEGKREIEWREREKERNRMEGKRDIEWIE